MAVTLVKSATLGGLNVGLAAAVGFINPMGAQIDALLALGLSPFEADLALQFNAALAAQAQISIQVSNPLAALQAALSALVQLQASLQLALTLPPITISLSAELTASAALAATLAAKLGGIAILIEAALSIKIPAIQAAASLAASLSAGPVFLHTFDGEQLGTTAAQIGTLFGDPGGLQDPAAPANNIATTDSVSGFIFTTKTPAAFIAMNAVFAT